MDRLLGLNNPNARALVVPQEEGTDETDTYFGSIGDATMKHIHSLSHADRQLWQELIHTKSGNVFRATPSLSSYDRDPMNLRGKDLDEYFEEMKRQAGGKLDDNAVAAIREAFDAEAERREQSEDAYDRAELIPYDQWHKYPGMEKHLDIPSTPRDLLVYMGNVNQMFYDEFPEGHPDEKLIRQVLMMVNRPYPHEIDEGYAGFVQDKILASHAKPYTIRYLVQMVNSMIDAIDPDEVVAEALLNIDRCWAIEYKNACGEKCKKDHVLHLLLHKEREWATKAKDGYAVYNEVKNFGQMLYQNFRDRMTSYHWARYRRMRDRHSPRVMVRGYDINRCCISEIQEALNLGRKAAENIWFNRPFTSLSQLYNKGYIDRGAFGSGDAADRILAFIEKQAEISLREGGPQRFSQVGHQIVRGQKERKVDLDHHAWRMIWTYYRIMRDDLVRQCNERKEETNEEV